jgi:hypothetical protein
LVRDRIGLLLDAISAPSRVIWPILWPQDAHLVAAFLSVLPELQLLQA